MDGLQLVVAEIALVVSIAALLAGVLGWLLGHGTGKRKAEKSFEETLSALRLGGARSAATDPEPAAPTVQTMGVVPSIAPVDAPVHPVTGEPGVITGVPTPLTAVEPEGVLPAPTVPEPVIATPAAPEPALPPSARFDSAATFAPTSPWSPPEATVIRPASGGTAVYTPSPFAILPSDPAGRPTSMAEVQELRRQLRAKDVEIGRIEAGVLASWDRTVPQLEVRLADLITANDALQRSLREAQEHSDADALTADHLRDLVADRDARLAELRSQG